VTVTGYMCKAHRSAHWLKRPSAAACKGSCSGGCQGVMWGPLIGSGSDTRACIRFTDAAKGNYNSQTALFQRPPTGATVASQCTDCAANNKAFASWASCPCPQGLAATGTDKACTDKATVKLAACPAGKTRLADAGCGGSSCVASRPCALKPEFKGLRGFAEKQFTWDRSCSADGAKSARTAAMSGTRSRRVAPRAIVPST